MKKKKLIILAVIFLYIFASFTFFVSAHSDGGATQAESIISSKVPCSELNQTQLISIGDYYMGQVFSPEQHEYMDNMMGGDDSPMAEQMHLSFAYRYYCNAQDSNNTDYDYGMMGGNYGMMGGNGAVDYSPSNTGYGMMGNGYNYGMMGYNAYYRTPFTYYLPWILLAVVIGAGIAVLIVSVERKRRIKHSKRRK